MKWIDRKEREDVVECLRCRDHGRHVSMLRDTDGVWFCPWPGCGNTYTPHSMRPKAVRPQPVKVELCPFCHTEPVLLFDYDGGPYCLCNMPKEAK